MQRCFGLFREFFSVSGILFLNDGCSEKTLQSFFPFLLKINSSFNFFLNLKSSRKNDDITIEKLWIKSKLVLHTLSKIQLDKSHQKIHRVPQIKSNKFRDPNCWASAEVVILKKLSEWGRQQTSSTFASLKKWVTFSRQFEESSTKLGYIFIPLIKVLEFHHDF